MQGAMLLNDGTAVDAYDLAVGEGLAHYLKRLNVKVGLVVGGNEYCSVDDEIVGISGWQTFAIIINRMGQTQLQQLVGMAVDCA